ncbi:MAG: hypothetical protein KC731_01710 [Myxococcales bacterium]|nr:hypothetical protein [Myxococcales bacterium]
MKRRAWIWSMVMVAACAPPAEENTAEVASPSRRRPHAEEPPSSGEGCCHNQGSGSCGLLQEGWTVANLAGDTVRLAFDERPRPRSYHVISMGASREEFEEHWGARLREDTTFTQGSMILSQRGRLVLRTEGEEILDGATRPFEAGLSYQRRGNSPAGHVDAWDERRPEEATPGAGLLSGPHHRISEVTGVAPGERPEVAFIEIYVGDLDDVPAEKCPEPVYPETCSSDLDCLGHPDGPACHPFAAFCGVDISDWGVIQKNTLRTRYFASPTIIKAGRSLVLSGATREDFEAYWGELPPNAEFASTGGTFPAIDGDETFELQAPPTWSKVDGPSPAMEEGKILSRSAEGLWSHGNATPGLCDSCGPGIFLSEIADTKPGGGYDPLEYVELFIGRP